MIHRTHKMISGECIYKISSYQASGMLFMLEPDHLMEEDEETFNKTCGKQTRFYYFRRACPKRCIFVPHTGIRGREKPNGPAKDSKPVIQHSWPTIIYDRQYEQ